MLPCCLWRMAAWGREQRKREFSIHSPVGREKVKRQPLPRSLVLWSVTGARNWLGRREMKREVEMDGKRRRPNQFSLPSGKAQPLKMVGPNIATPGSGVAWEGKRSFLATTPGRGETRVSTNSNPEILHSTANIAKVNLWNHTQGERKSPSQDRRGRGGSDRRPRPLPRHA